ncbi:MAG: arylsulfatase [Fimbriimonadaceae bacterium]|nr:arylsulfatase [Fimbriimonadaceae bacterium]
MPVTTTSRRSFLQVLSAGTALAAGGWVGRAARAARRPNVVVILTDDLGYGDLSCYGATAVQTPHLDRLAAGGLQFTDGHSGAATCTPSRYAMLSGEYAFRKPGTGVLPGDANLILDPQRLSLASLLRGAGYRTGCVGKWHLGLGRGPLDWNAELRPGPLEVGFEECFILPATGDRVPTVYVRDRRVVGLDPADPLTVSYKEPLTGLPTGREHPELLTLGLTHGHDQSIVHGISRIGYQRGGRAAWWRDESIADVFRDEALAFVERHRAEPFFLYLATHDIHVPRVPHPRFVGATALGPRGDAIVQLDATVGALLDALDRHGLTDDTLLIFSSDNGPVLDDGYADQAVARLGQHRPAGPWQGGKYSPYEGGTRVPFLVRWPQRIRPGRSDALVSQIDLLASLAALLEVPLPAAAAPDSFNVLPALLGESPTGRTQLVEQASSLALREGTWKFIPPRGGANGRPAELFDLAADPGEEHNLAPADPARATAMQATLRQLREAGRSRPTTP